MGLSAGAICWFEAGHSDGDCFSGNEDGRESFDYMISDTEYVGLALESETAYVENDSKKFIIGSRNGAKAWLFFNNKKQELEVIPC